MAENIEKGGVVICPACSKNHFLPTEYLKGAQFTCEGCSNTIIIDEDGKLTVFGTDEVPQADSVDDSKEIDKKPDSEKVVDSNDKPADRKTPEQDENFLGQKA